MTNMQSEFKTPQNSSFEEFKKSCFLVPLSSDLKIDKWRGNGSKVNTEALRNFIAMGVKADNPNVREKQLKNIVDVSLKNLVETLSSYLSISNPCIAVAYPLNSNWILAFLTNVFNMEKLNTDEDVLANADLGIFEAIKELNGDPYLYTYTLMQRESEQDSIQEVHDKSSEELARLNKIKEEIDTAKIKKTSHF